MGGCCCCPSRRAGSENIPVYFYYPPVLEHAPFPSHDTTPISPAILVDTNLDTSTPDTYQAPPAPLPYDAITETTNADGIEASALCEGPKELDGKGKLDCVQDSPKTTKDEPAKLNNPIALPLEEDVCPICLEEYDLENPRIITKCEHHFHLSCILEWMERRDTCPICDQGLGPFGCSWVRVFYSEQ